MSYNISEYSLEKALFLIIISGLSRKLSRFFAFSSCLQLRFHLALSAKYDALNSVKSFLIRRIYCKSIRPLGNKEGSRKRNCVFCKALEDRESA